MVTLTFPGAAALALTTLMLISPSAVAQMHGRPDGAYGDGSGHGPGAAPASASPAPYRQADRDLWHRGAWWQGRHEGRDGWWWIAGNRWYWYPAPVYPMPVYPAPAPAPASPVSGSYPAPGIAGNGGQDCREYQQTVMVGGQPSPAYGTACRQADGSWKIISQN